MTPEQTRDLQKRLRGAGYDPGPLDGDLGPRTWSALLAFTVRGKVTATVAALGAALAKHAPGVLETPLDLVHFTGQAAHETGAFNNLVELGGPTYCARYDGRADLGNVHPGDGYRYRGRGIFMNTGRDAYRALGEEFDLPLEAEPWRVSEPELAVRAALWFWTTRKLGRLAARDDLLGITKRINGGTNGGAERRAFRRRLAEVLV